jgi:poly(3-hydroxybutyrate) depolymerase
MMETMIDFFPARRCVSVLLIVLVISISVSSAGERVTSGEYFVKQSWSQENRFDRPYFVNVPTKTTKHKLPVFLFLHGNGGNGKRAMKSFLTQHRTMAENYVMVFPEGYLKSWNIVSERSKADDLGFIEVIIERLADCENVQKNNFTIMGSSNGAALVNQLAIESRLPNIQNLITGVSPLNTFQHDGRNFRAKGENNDYGKAVTPLTGRRLMNISGTEDRLVPYQGGRSRVIPAKGGKLTFVDAEESTFRWAKAMGYKGRKLTRPSRVDGQLSVFSYLDGNVVHYRASGEGHGATRRLSEETLLRFLRAGISTEP